MNTDGDVACRPVRRSLGVGGFIGKTRCSAGPWPASSGRQAFMELTKEHFDQAVKGLATQDSLDELVKTVSEMQIALNVHTTALDTLLKARQIKTDEKTVFAERFTRLELWAKQVGKKLGIQLEL